MSFNTGRDPMGEGDEQIVSDINMTPLIDVMLVLLIIFMVTSTISNNDSGLDINLPQSSQGKPVKGEDKRPVILSLDKQGALSLGGVSVEREGLKERIAAELQKLGTDMVVFEGDQNAMLGEAVKIMDIAKSAGAAKFAVATQQ